MRRGRDNRTIRFCGDGKDQICLHRPVDSWELDLLQKTGADFFERFLRAKVLFAGDKDDAIDESEGMIEHELLQLAIVGSAPEFALQKSPTHFYFTIR